MSKSGIYLVVSRPLIYSPFDGPSWSRAHHTRRIVWCVHGVAWKIWIIHYHPCTRERLAFFHPITYSSASARGGVHMTKLPLYGRRRKCDDIITVLLTVVGINFNPFPRVERPSRLKKKYCFSVNHARFCSTYSNRPHTFIPLNNSFKNAARRRSLKCVSARILLLEPQ